MKNNLVHAVFVSVWDDGFEVETGCMVDMDTKEVVEIEMEEDPDILENLDILEREYIRFDDGTEFPVYQEDECSEGDFWYN